MIGFLQELLMQAQHRLKIDQTRVVVTVPAVVIVAVQMVAVVTACRHMRIC